ncbi:MAG: hypothetical protein U0694_05390 [Anaerolineae bacterium]
MSRHQDIIAQAHEHWMADDRPLELGRVLYDPLPPAQRPLWAASILRLASTRIDEIPEIVELLSIAENRERWGEARALLDALANRMALENALQQWVVALAVKVAQITCNALEHPQRFPHDVGWKLIADLHEIVNLVNHDAFTAQVWDVLVAPCRA